MTTIEATATDKRAELVEKLRNGIKSVQDSDRLADYLRFSAKFHRYSFHNTMLIWLQRPEATQVAGFNAWKALGRSVKKGEKGIAIFAPIPWKRTNADDEEESGIWFKVVYVFDLAQTDGDELPTMTEKLEGDAPALCRDLSDLAGREGLTIIRDEKNMPGTNGYLSPVAKEVWIDPAIAGNSAMFAQVLAHELSHWFTDRECVVGRAEREIVADGAAYIVLGHHGVDAGAFSFDYIATWSSREEAGCFEKRLAEIHEVANKILEGMD